jgi:hypothetical protein
MKLWPTEKQANYVFTILPTPEVLARALKSELKAVHPVTGEALPPMHACTPRDGNPPTSTMTMGSEHTGVCTDRAQRASCAQHDGVTIDEDESCGHTPPVHTPGEDAGYSGHTGSVHAASIENRRPNSPSVHTMHTHAHPGGATSADKTKANGEYAPDCACVHGGGTSHIGMCQRKDDAEEIMEWRA